MPISTEGLRVKKVVLIRLITIEECIYAAEEDLNYLLIQNQFVVMKNHTVQWSFFEKSITIESKGCRRDDHLVMKCHDHIFMRPDLY